MPMDEIWKSAALGPPMERIADLSAVAVAPDGRRPRGCLLCPLSEEGMRLDLGFADSGTVAGCASNEIVWVPLPRSSERTTLPVCSCPGYPPAGDRRGDTEGSNVTVTGRKRLRQARYRSCRIPKSLVVNSARKSLLPGGCQAPTRRYLYSVPSPSATG